MQNANVITAFAGNASIFDHRFENTLHYDMRSRTRIDEPVGFSVASFDSY